MLTTITDGDPMRIMAAIVKVREHHDWHDGSTIRGKPKFKLPDNPVILLTGCCVAAHGSRISSETPIRAYTNFKLPCMHMIYAWR